MRNLILFCLLPVIAGLVHGARLDGPHLTPGSVTSERIKDGAILGVDISTATSIQIDTMTLTGNAFSVGTSTLVITNGQVGIGASPAFPFDVLGGTFIITLQGLTGIGTTAPIALLDIRGDDTNAGNIEGIRIIEASDDLNTDPFIAQKKFGGSLAVPTNTKLNMFTSFWGGGGHDGTDIVGSRSDFSTIACDDWTPTNRCTDARLTVRTKQDTRHTFWLHEDGEISIDGGFRPTPTAKLNINMNSADLFGLEISSADASTIFRVGHDGNVSIGTTSPSTSLDVNGDAQFGSGATKSTFTAAGNLQTVSGFTVTGGTVSFKERVAIGSGIPTSDTSTSLHVSGGNLLIDNDKAITWIANDGTIHKAMTVESTDDLTIGSSSFDDVVIKVGTLGEALRISQITGNVGIGNASPSATFEVLNGTFVITSQGLTGIGTTVPIALLDIRGDDTNGAGFAGNIEGIRIIEASDDLNTDPFIAQKKFGGSLASPTNTKLNMFTSFWGGGGHDGTDIVGSRGDFSTIACDNWTLSNRCTDSRLTTRNKQDVRSTFWLHEDGQITIDGGFRPTPIAKLNIKLDSSDLFALDISSADSSTILRVEHSGDVGIGITSPEANLHVVGDSGNVLIIGSGTAVSQRLWIVEATGDLLPGTLAQQNIGSPSAPINEIFVGQQSIQFVDTSGVVTSSLSISASGTLQFNGFNLMEFDGDLTLASGADFGLSGPLTLDGSTLTVTGNAFSVGTSTLVVVDGNVGIGTTSPDSRLNIIGEGAGATSRIRAVRYGSSGSATLQLFRSNGTLASPTALINGDTAGNLQYGGYNGSSLEPGGAINAVATENWSGTAQGTKIEFKTTDNTTTTRDLRMTIDQNGNVGIGTEGPGAQLELSNTTVGADFIVNASTFVVKDGRVGIGTTAPSKLLDVAGDVQFGCPANMTSFGRGCVSGVRTAGTWETVISDCRTTFTARICTYLDIQQACAAGAITSVGSTITWFGDHTGDNTVLVSFVDSCDANIDGSPEPTSNSRPGRCCL